MTRHLRLLVLVATALVAGLTTLVQATPTSAAPAGSAATATTTTSVERAQMVTYVRGRIVNRSGNPIAGVYVSVRNATLDEVLGGPVRTGRYGYFRIDGITEEEIAVRINGWDRGFERGWLTCRPNNVVPTWGQACSRSPGALGEIPLDRR